MKHLFRIALIGALWLGAAGCAELESVMATAGAIVTEDAATTAALTAAPPTAASSAGAPAWGHRTKTAGCVVRGALPDPACTPGDIFPDATKDKICVSGYSSSVRDVPTSVKSAVYAEYGIAHHSSGEFEIDHFVSLELGGSNDISNLFPEAAAPKPGFHEKDKVENYLHDQVCSGAITLAEAQRQIASNWVAIYDRMPKK